VTPGSTPGTDIVGEPARLDVRALPGLPDLRGGDDLAALVLAAVASTGPDALADGDVLVVSSKAVAKVEGRTSPARRTDVVDAETDRDVARRGLLRIVRTRHGLVLAAAGVDASNTPVGTVVPLPVDPDASARRLRTEVLDRAGRNIAVVVTDTAGRPWRTGQTDLAVGCAGLPPLLDLSGTPDAYGRPLEVTAPAVADEVAGAGALVLGKAARTPVAVVRGLHSLVAPPGAHGPGAGALVRREAEDLFGLGSADAVRAAVRRGSGDGRGFAAGHETAADLAADWGALAVSGPAGARVGLVVEPGPDGGARLALRPATGLAADDPDVSVAVGAVGERLRVLAWSDGWQLVGVDPGSGVPGAVVSWTLRPRP